MKKNQSVIHILESKLKGVKILDAKTSKITRFHTEKKQIRPVKVIFPNAPGECRTVASEEEFGGIAYTSGKNFLKMLDAHPEVFSK